MESDCMLYHISEDYSIPFLQLTGDNSDKGQPDDRGAGDCCSPPQILEKPANTPMNTSTNPWTKEFDQLSPPHSLILVPGGRYPQHLFPLLDK